MADELVVKMISERRVQGKPLGRHVEHDPQSLEYSVIEQVVPKGQPIVSVAHARHAPPFNQGTLGSCTGNAAAGLLMTDPFFTQGRTLTESDAVLLYEKATHLDRIAGAYPPDDTGSSGLAVMKAAKGFGYVSAYHHAFGLDAALRTLSVMPVITGVAWYEGFDNPDASGYVAISGSVRGGHEFEVLGNDTDKKRVRACNSWGDSWGDHGYFEFSWDDFDRLLHEQGDVTVAAS